MKISIYYRICLGFLLLILAIILIYLIKINFKVKEKKIQKEYLFLRKNKESFENLIFIQNVFFLEFNNEEYNSLLKQINFVRDMYSQINVDSDIYQSDELNEMIKTVIDKLNIFCDSYEIYLDECKRYGLENLKNKDIEEDEYDLIKADLLDKRTFFFNDSEQIMHSFIDISDMADAQNLKKIKAKNLFIFLFMLLSFIICLVILVILIMEISVAFYKLINFSNKVSDGDFSVKINFNFNDELTRIAEGIKKIGKFDIVLSNIKKSVSIMNNSYDRVNEAVNKISNDTKKQEINVRTATKEFEKLAIVLDEISRDSEETRKISVQTEERTKDSSLQIKNSFSDISLLSEFVKKIIGTINTINLIAEQIELLSLNAAIEAAKAGTSGKGFAVVATEVGKLADLSTDATREISFLAQDIIDKIKNTTDKTENTFGQLLNIEARIADVTGKIELISGITLGKSIRNKDIIRQVNKVNEITGLNIDNALLIIDNNMRLKNQVDELMKLSKEFKLSK